jgi:hypothetical protein
LIREDTDVVITHNPPRSVPDLSYASPFTGYAGLLGTVTRSRPRSHYTHWTELGTRRRVQSPLRGVVPQAKHRPMSPTFAAINQSQLRDPWDARSREVGYTGSGIGEDCKTGSVCRRKVMIAAESQSRSSHTHCVPTAPRSAYQHMLAVHTSIRSIIKEGK